MTFSSSGGALAALRGGFGGGGSGEEEFLAVAGKGERALVAEDEAFGRARGGGAPDFHGGGGAAGPEVGFALGLFRGGIVAVADDHRLGLRAVPGELRVFALAGKECGGGGGGAGGDGVEAVVGLGLRGNGIKEGLAVARERTVEGIFEGALAARAEIAQDQFGAEFFFRRAGGGGRTGGTAPGRGLGVVAVVVFPGFLRGGLGGFRLIGFGGIRFRFFQVGEPGPAARGDLKTFHRRHPDRFGGGEVDDDEAVLRAVLGLFLVLPGLGDLGLGRMRRGDDEPAVAGENQSDIFHDRRRFWIG